LKDYSEIKTSFGLHVKKIREKKGYTLRDVDNNCALDESNISKIENGRVNIQLSTILELAKGLGVKPKDLLDFEL
jgi:DNA-binding Xre family transcriptional regulator